MANIYGISIYIYSKPLFAHSFIFFILNTVFCVYIRNYICLYNNPDIIQIYIYIYIKFNCQRKCKSTNNKTRNKNKNKIRDFTSQFN